MWCFGRSCNKEWLEYNSCFIHFLKRFFEVEVGGMWWYGRCCNKAGLEDKSNLLLNHYLPCIYFIFFITVSDSSWDCYLYYEYVVTSIAGCCYYYASSSWRSTIYSVCSEGRFVNYFPCWMVASFFNATVSQPYIRCYLTNTLTYWVSTLEPLFIHSSSTRCYVQ